MKERQRIFVPITYMIISVVFILVAKPVIAQEPISPIPQQVQVDKKKVQLGKKLFHDPRLSANNTISCATCHPLDNAGMDGTKFSNGINGNLGVINTPTVFNSSLNFFQHWDGRAATLEDQIDNPIHNPNEMGSDWPTIVAKLQKDQVLNKLFKEIYNEGINPTTIKDAIAAFEHTLLTPNSRFDRYLRGETEAITNSELEGYKLFKAYGCASCHQGEGVGGNMFETMGVFRNYFADRGGITISDLGRFNITGEEKDRHKFKVPSLRNVELTAPYFHDGTASTLTEAIQVMAKYQLGRAMPGEDSEKIAEFLRTLTGEFGEYTYE